MEKEHYYYFYLHKNTINNKVYIGMTYQNHPEKRWKNGTSYKNNIYFHRAIEKYGWDKFEHIILEEGNFIKAEADIREFNLINLYDSRNPSKGYNINPGGYKGISPNALKNAIKWMKQHPEFGLACIKNMQKWQNEHPEEMLRMRRENANKATESHKRKVKCIETGIIYESTIEASRQVPNTLQGKICLVCQGKRLTNGGFHWEYANE